MANRGIHHRPRRDVPQLPVPVLPRVLHEEPRFVSLLRHHERHGRVPTAVAELGERRAKRGELVVQNGLELLLRRKSVSPVLDVYWTMAWSTVTGHRSEQSQGR